MLMLDALQPVGVVSLQADANALIPALGGVARIKPEAVVQVLDSSGLENLCTCINLSGTPRKGQAAVKVSITTVKGETEKFTVHGGELWVYPLSIGVHAVVRLSVARGLSVRGRHRLKLDVDGGTAGLIIDARGRPLPLATSLKALSVQIPEWYAQATGNPAFEIPPEWLVPTVIEPEIMRVVDRRKAEADRVLSVLGESDESTAEKPRRRLFGRRSKAMAEEAVGEGEEDDIRNLLS
jgi:hypothetical protein